MIARASVGAVLAIVVLAGCSEPVDFERMRQQPRADPYAASPVFADGMTMRIPPAGTVPVTAAAAPSTDVPLAITADVLAHGQHDFEIYCAVCHGKDAAGDSVMAVNMPETPPPSLVSGASLDLRAADLFEVASHGKNRMPGYAWALPSDDRWAVVAYVQMLQGAH